MFTHKPVCRLGVRVTKIITRNQGKAIDPVQQLFITKLKEYKAKSGKGDEFVEPSPAILNELKKELDKLEKSYAGGKGVDLTGFPEFRFQEPTLDPIDEVPEKEEKSDDKKKK